MSDAEFNERCKYMKFVLAQPNNFPSSLHVCKQILAVEDVWQYSIHYCPKLHKIYDKLDRSCWKHNAHECCGVDGCMERRFNTKQTTAGFVVYPRYYFLYFGVERAIRHLYANSEFPSLRASALARSRDDIWSGELVRRMDEQLGGKLLAEQSVVARDGQKVFLRKAGLLDVGYDGAQVWQHKKHGVGFLLARLWDVPFEVRGKEQFTHLICLIPGPKEPDYWALQKIFLVPLINELTDLAQEGITGNILCWIPCKSYTTLVV